MLPNVRVDGDLQWTDGDPIASTSTSATRTPSAGRIAAFEILVGAVANVIREGTSYQLVSMTQTGNLVDEVVETHRRPSGGCAETERAPRGGSVTPNALPDVTLSVDAILGPLAR